MSRFKSSLNGPLSFSFPYLGNFKNYSTDFLFDFEAIYTSQFERFRDMMNDACAKRQRKAIATLHKHKVGLKASDCARAYLVTSLTLVPLAMKDIEDCIVNHLIETATANNVSNENEYFIEDPDHVVTLFIFKGRELVFSHDVSIWTAMTMLIAYSKENLINAGAFRDAWYGKPRRKERSEQRLKDYPG